jgi:nicotinate-nucleotide adenylyltransferase
VRLGIMGGTFDPIHLGHLVTAEEARVQYALDSVLFVPTGVPALKTHRAVSPAEDRYLMVALATAGNPAFDVSRIEIDRPGVTYTVDTLLQLRQIYGADVELFFITGADALSEMASWKDIDRVAKLATFIGATRPGYDVEAAAEVREVMAAGIDIDLLDVPELAISSTDIRKRVAQGRALNYLTPEHVTAFIRKRGLYQGADA